MLNAAGYSTLVASTPASPALFDGIMHDTPLRESRTVLLYHAIVLMSYIKDIIHWHNFVPMDNRRDIWFSGFRHDTESLSVCVGFFQGALVSPTIKMHPGLG